MTSALPHDEFFSALQDLLTVQSTAARGSIFLTQKRFPSPDNAATKDDIAGKPAPSAILIRVSNGRHKDAKVKASTLVEPHDLEAFYVRYAEICKAGMVGLKKRDRSAKKKSKAKAKK
ncbi:hypothetical protein FQN57_001527 [Myotisia sp. PD_48]|nr:hypothetical protein FQN57_001527 [Myotisia sp. PD_48]